MAPKNPKANTQAHGVPQPKAGSKPKPEPHQRKPSRGAGTGRRASRVQNAASVGTGDCDLQIVAGASSAAAQPKEPDVHRLETVAALLTASKPRLDANQAGTENMSQMSADDLEAETLSELSNHFLSSWGHRRGKATA